MGGAAGDVREGEEVVGEEEDGGGEGGLGRYVLSVVVEPPPTTISRFQRPAGPLDETPLLEDVTATVRLPPSLPVDRPEIVALPERRRDLRLAV